MVLTEDDKAFIKILYLIIVYGLRIFMTSYCEPSSNCVI